MKKIWLLILALMICVPAYAAGNFTVQGTVKLSTGAPAPGLTVQLLQKQPKASLLQGSTKTAQNGTYRIVYSPQANPKAKGITIFIRVLNSKGARLYQSTPINRAKTSEVLNVNLP